MLCVVRPASRRTDASLCADDRGCDLRFSCDACEVVAITRTSEQACLTTQISSRKTMYGVDRCYTGVAVDRLVGENAGRGRRWRKY